jgi:type VI secretion system protein VasJ
MSEDRTTWKALGAEPINAENPSGKESRYEPEFERLQDEMQKLESLSGEPIDWKQVVVLSREILEKKSKDLLVGSYLVLGLLETEGHEGLLNGLTCLDGMIRSHWESLFPAVKRMRARINALNWLSEKAGSIISRNEPGQDNGNILGACEEQVKVLEALMNDKINPEEPVFGELYRPIQEQLNRIQAASVDTTRPATDSGGKLPAEPMSTTAIPATESATMIETPEDAKRALKNTFGSLKKIASITRSQDLTRPLPYRLIRFLTWCETEAPPPAENGKSRVPPPPNQLRDRFRTLSEQSAWKELVIQVEAKVPEFPFWLDLHRICDAALAELGPDYVNARNAIKSEVVTLLNRLPDLIEIEFSDGTPFADRSTRDWISTQILPETVTEPVEAIPSGNEPDFLAEVQSKSRQLLKEGDQKSALNLVQEFTRSASTGHQRFLSRLELANLCIEIGNNKAALAHLEMLDDQITQYSLDIWEPQLALQALQIYYRTLIKTLRETKHPEPELSRLADSVFSRLCRLDVLAGLNAIK